VIVGNSLAEDPSSKAHDEQWLRRGYVPHEEIERWVLVAEPAWSWIAFGGENRLPAGHDVDVPGKSPLKVGGMPIPETDLSGGVG
jgi:hypothetical protein